MPKKKKKKTKNKARDVNIYLSAKGEISLATKTVNSKKAYSRKRKHKASSE